MFSLLKIDKLVIKAFFGPFFLSFAIVLFILLIVFMSHYFEDLAGKDLGWGIYAKLFGYFALVITPQALPLAVLLAALMSFGDLGENYEITAVKSAGIPLTRLLIPMGCFAVLITIGAYLFNNYIAPEANLKAFSLMYDVRQKKPTLEFKEGGFYNDLPDYKIRVERKGRQENDSTVYGVMIYDHTSQRGNSDLILADTGKMYTILDNNYLVMELRRGNKFSEYSGQNTGKKEFVRDEFLDARFVFSLASLGMNETPEELFKSHKIMKRVHELGFIADSLDKQSLIQAHNLAESTKPYFDYQFAADRAKYFFSPQDSVPNDYLQYRKNLTRADYGLIYERAISKTQNLKSLGTTNKDRIGYLTRESKSFRVEQHKRFSTSIACFIMFLIGAPLGSIIRKGGLGVPVLISIIFFLLYYFISITGEKYGREGVTPLIVGAWAADAILLFFGLLFLMQARVDSRLFDADAYLVWLNRHLPWLMAKLLGPNPVSQKPAQTL
jgi:lipopolysaccharide export system permease protein